MERDSDENKAAGSNAKRKIREKDKKQVVKNENRQ